MSATIESYGVWLADYYLLASVILALSLVGVTLLKQPAQRLAIAKSTLVSLVLLAILCAVPGWSVIHLFAASPSQPVLETHEAIATQPITATEQPRPVVVAPLIAPKAEVPDPATVAATSDSASEYHIPWPAMFVAAHLTGLIAILGWLLLGWLAALRLRRTAIPAPPTATDILNKLLTANHNRPPRVELLTHDRIDVPVALGVWRPAIILPARFIESAIRNPKSEIASVLAHESAHILNRDLRWVALARCLFIALWANPLFWLARRRLRLDQEALADAAAAEVTSRQRYAEQLVAWARNMSARPALHLSSAVGLWEGPSQLRQRIALLLNEQLTVLRNCSRRWRIAAAMLGTGMVIALSLITIQPGRTAPPAHSSVDNASINPPSTGTLKIRFEYDGAPPAPNEIKEGGWRSADNRVLRTFNVEKRVGAKVFDESLVVGEDRGIANVFVWARSQDIPVPSPQELPPVTITYKQGRLSPRVLAFQAPRRLVMRNEGIEACGFHYEGASVVFNRLVPKGEEESVVVKPDRFPVRITTTIEHWRSGIAYVLPFANPFAAVSGKNGVARIENLPPGKWEFQVWHERTGWVKTAAWRMGRFTLEIKPGENDLGKFRISPEALKVGADARHPSAEPVAASASASDQHEQDAVKPNGLQNGGKIQLVQNTNPITEKTESNLPPGILGYGDDKPDGKKSLGGSGEMIRFELPEGVTKIEGIRIHGSRYGSPQVPKEDFEITFLNDKRNETLHVEAAPYRLFNRGKEQWVRVAFKNEVELPRKFWVCLNFNAQQTEGVYVSYDTSTKGEYSRVGLPGDKEEPKPTDFKGDWMVQLLLAKREK